MTLNDLLTAAKGYPAAPVTLDFQLPDFDAVTIFNALKEAKEPGFINRSSEN